MLALLLLLVGLAFGEFDPQERLSNPAQRFNTRSLEEALSLSFSAGDFVVKGRGVSRGDVELSPRYTDEATIEGDGLKFGAKRAGYLSVSNVDLRGSNFLSDAVTQGLIFKMRYNFGTHTSVCSVACETLDLPPSSCGTDPSEYRSYRYGEPAVLFQHSVESRPENLLFTVQRFDGLNRKNIASCDDQVVYTFTLNYGVGGRMVWNVYSGHSIWLEDGKDHEIVLTAPRNPTRTQNSLDYNMLYIDGRFICISWDDPLSPLPYEDEADFYYHCRSSATSITPDGNRFTDETDLKESCYYSRFYFGQAIAGWSSDGSFLPSQPRKFGKDHLNVTLKRFEVWNYEGVPVPDDPFFCRSSDACFYYRGSPWCRSLQGLGDLEQLLKRDTLACPTYSAPCNALGTEANCGFVGDKCPAEWSCCSGVCKDMASDATCGDCGTVCTDEQQCCGGTCTNVYSDANNCYGCGNVCTNGVCCGGLQGCTGSDTHCTACGDSCYALNVAGDDDYHCCPNTTAFECVNFLGNVDDNCGACGNVCSGSTSSCCGGQCVSLGDNENCAACGDVCKTTIDGVKQACCNGGCVTLDTDGNCGSCGHDCGVIGLQMNKTLHCCDGLCVEWGTDLRSCGCPSTDCQQEYNELLGVTSFQCCADGIPPTTRPQCVDSRTEAACGTCGNICGTTEFCCEDLASAGGHECRDFTMQDSCGACDVSCGPLDVSVPSACCAVGPGDYGCVPIGTLTDCNSCGDSCFSSDTCCPVIGFPTAGTPTTFTCRDTMIDDQYCGSTCTDCTQGGTVTDVFCCLGVCTQVGSTTATCGCSGPCSSGLECCLGPVTAPALPDYHVCLPLHTQTDCAACGDACTGTDLCCPTTADPSISQCLDVSADPLNCGACGTICDAALEACCDGHCVSVNTIDTCGGCGVSCGDAEFCCVQPAGTFDCQGYSNTDTACGCPDNPVDCTAIPPPDENHPDTFSCCKGLCVPSWQHCFD